MAGHQLYFVGCDQYKEYARTVYCFGPIASWHKPTAAAFARSRQFNFQYEKFPKTALPQVRAGDHITFVPPDPPAIHVAAEPMALDILHEDAHVVVINKAPHVVVHPAPGRRTGTLVNGLLHHFGVDKLAPDVNGKLPVSFE